jgi:hypothetical protein
MNHHVIRVVGLEGLQFTTNFSPKLEVVSGKNLKRLQTKALMNPC